MAIIQYSISDLKDNSSKLTKESESINNALSNLNNLNNNINTHWTGNDQKAYNATFANKTTSLKNYISEVQTIAANLNTAADYYQKHEDQFNVDLW